jgi:hypothetical protein
MKRVKERGKKKIKTKNKKGGGLVIKLGVFLLFF